MPTERANSRKGARGLGTPSVPGSCRQRLEEAIEQRRHGDERGALPRCGKGRSPASGWPYPGGTGAASLRSLTNRPAERQPVRFSESGFYVSRAPVGYPLTRCFCRRPAPTARHSPRQTYPRDRCPCSPRWCRAGWRYSILLHRLDFAAATPSTRELKPEPVAAWYLSPD